MSTSTKAKCEALAKAHTVTIELLGQPRDGYSYWLTIPNDKIMEDGCTGRTGHELFMPMAEVWGFIMADLKDILQHDWLNA